MNQFTAARVRAGLNHRQAATALGTSTAYLCRVEKGETKPGADSLTKMADLYGCSVDALLGRAPLEAQHAG